MLKRVPTKKRMVIPSAWLVRALADHGPVHSCRNCGERMFVRYESGLCPLCFNGRRTYNLRDAVHCVSQGNALAGVLDDPSIEEIVDAIGE